MILAKNLFDLLFLVLQLFTYALFLAAIVNTLISFGVLDSRNRIVWTVADFLARVTEPVVRPVRNLMPNFGGIDLSFWVVLLLIRYVVQPLLLQIELAAGIPIY